MCYSHALLHQTELFVLIKPCTMMHPEHKHKYTGKKYTDLLCVPMMIIIMTPVAFSVSRRFLARTRLNLKRNVFVCVSVYDKVMILRV